MPARGAAERLRIVGVEHVEDEVRVGMVVDQDEAVRLERPADRAHPAPRALGDVDVPQIAYFRIAAV